MVVSLLVGGTASAQAPGWVVRGQDAAVGSDEGDGLAAVVGAHAVQPGPGVVAAAAANLGGVGRCGHRYLHIHSLFAPTAGWSAARRVDQVPPPLLPAVSVTRVQPSHRYRSPA